MSFYSLSHFSYDLPLTVTRSQSPLKALAANDMRMLRKALLIGILLGTVASAPPLPANIPYSWKNEDMPGSTTFWAVEIQRFDSQMLASTMLKALSDKGLGPLNMQVETTDATALLLGKFQDPGEAFHVAEELRVNRVAKPRLVTAVSGAPQSVVIPPDFQLAPFTPSPDKNFAQPEEATIIKLLNEVATTSDLSADAEIRTAASLWEAKQTANPALGDGAYLAARRFWDAATNPEESLFLAGKVARGEWAASPQARSGAQDLVSDLLYGHRRDWRGAWLAAAIIQEQSVPSSERALAARLRQIALEVELIDKSAAPNFSFATIRGHLRQLAEATPDTFGKLHADIQLIYLNTFAWEGNWERVDQVGAEIIATSAEFPYHASMARILRAQSLERKESWLAALSLLAEARTTLIPKPLLPRMGMTTFDPAVLAAEKAVLIESLANGIDKRTGLPVGERGGAPPVIAAPTTVPVATPVVSGEVVAESQ